MKKEIDKMIDYLTQLTKEEADLIESVCKWPDEYKVDFCIAKKMFDKEHEDDQE